MGARRPPPARPVLTPPHGFRTEADGRRRRHALLARGCLGGNEPLSITRSATRGLVGSGVDRPARRCVGCCPLCAALLARRFSHCLCIDPSATVSSTTVEHSAHAGGPRHMNIRVPGRRTMGGHDAYATRETAAARRRWPNDRRPAAQRAGGCHADGVDGGPGAPGDLDTTFAGDGTTSTVGSGSDRCFWRRHPGGRQDRGQRSLSNGSNSDFAVVRYMPMAPSTRASTPMAKDHGNRRHRRYRLRVAIRRTARSCQRVLPTASISRWCATCPTAPSTELRHRWQGNHRSAPARIGDGVAIQADGKIVVSRPRSTAPSISPWCATSTAPSTRPSTSMAGDHGNRSCSDIGFGVAIQADGKIVVSGSWRSAATTMSPWCATCPTAPSTRASTPMQGDHLDRYW